MEKYNKWMNIIQSIQTIFFFTSKPLSFSLSKLREILLFPPNYKIMQVVLNHTGQGRSSTDKDYDRDSRHKRDDHKKHKKDDRDRRRDDKKKDEHRKKDKQDDRRRDERKRVCERMPVMFFVTMIIIAKTSPKYYSLLEIFVFFYIVPNNFEINYSIEIKIKTGIEKKMKRKKTRRKTNRRMRTRKRKLNRRRIRRNQ